MIFHLIFPVSIQAHQFRYCIRRQQALRLVAYLKNNSILYTLFYLEEYNRYRIDVIITPEFDILISPDDATKKMLSSHLNLLDMNWYLCKIMSALTNENILVEGFSYTQF